MRLIIIASIFLFSQFSQSLIAQETTIEFDISDAYQFVEGMLGDQETIEVGEEFVHIFRKGRKIVIHEQTFDDEKGTVINTYIIKPNGRTKMWKTVFGRKTKVEFDELQEILLITKLVILRTIVDLQNAVKDLPERPTQRI